MKVSAFHFIRIRKNWSRILKKMSKTHPQEHEDYHNEIKKQMSEYKGRGTGHPMKLSPELADLIGKGIASRSECTKKMWDYLKMNNLQDPYNRQYLMPDTKLAKIVGNERIRAFGMTNAVLSSHLLSQPTVEEILSLYGPTPSFLMGRKSRF